MNRNPFFNFDGIDKSVAVVNKNWREFRRDINEGAFSPDDVDSALNHIFLKTFDDLFSACKGIVGLTKKLHIVHHEYQIMRGAKISLDEASDTITYGRLLPQKDYIKDDNRFSPKGIEWLYLAISDNPSLARSCCIEECRANKNDNFALVSFEIPNEYRDKEIVDLTVGVEYDYTDLENSLEKSVQSNFNKDLQEALRNLPRKIKKMRKSKMDKYIGKKAKKISEATSLYNRECLMKFLTLTYSKLISENIFEPVDTNKSEKYAPFHCLAQYFLNNGYVGIIYSSTVCKGGKNLVLFDKNYALPVGDISKITV